MLGFEAPDPSIFGQLVQGFAGPADRSHSASGLAAFILATWRVGVLLTSLRMWGPTSEVFSLSSLSGPHVFVAAVLARVIAAS